MLWVRSVAVSVLAVGLAACGSDPDPAMPDVVGKRLDVAQSDVKRAGVMGDVEVQGGGALGILVESNWLVCEQKPAAGQAVTVAPRLTVGRSCGGEAAEPTIDTKTEPAAEPQTDGSSFKFGQPARFTSTAGSNDIPLEFTVSAPTAFTPTKDATIFDKRAVGGAQEGTLRAVNVYFTLTIRNLSSTQTFDPDFVFSDVAETSADDEVSEVIDGDIQSTNALEKTPPGASITIKDGYSVKSAENIVYELDVDGLAGRSFHFSQ